MALLNKGTTLMELQPAAAIEAFDQIVERYGRAAEPALRGETAAALLNKGAALIMLGQAGEAVAAYELMVERCGDRPGPRTPQDRGGGPQTAVRAPRDGGEGRTDTAGRGRTPRLDQSSQADYRRLVEGRRPVKPAARVEAVSTSRDVRESQVIDMDSLRYSPTAVLFEGGRFGGIQATSFIVSTPPGAGPGLHVHPYPEVFMVLNGQVTFQVGDQTIEAHADQIVIGPAQVPHKFTNTGTEPLRIVSIHVSDHLIQEFLEE